MELFATVNRRSETRYFYGDYLSWFADNVEHWIIYVLGANKAKVTTKDCDQCLTKACSTTKSRHISVERNLKIQTEIARILFRDKDPRPRVASLEDAPDCHCEEGGAQ